MNAGQGTSLRPATRRRPCGFDHAVASALVASSRFSPRTLLVNGPATCNAPSARTSGEPAEAAARGDRRGSTSWIVFRLMTRAAEVLRLRQPLRDRPLLVRADRGERDDPVHCARFFLRGKGLGVEAYNKHEIRTRAVARHFLDWIEGPGEHRLVADFQLVSLHLGALVGAHEIYEPVTCLRSRQTRRIVTFAPERASSAKAAVGTGRARYGGQHGRAVFYIPAALSISWPRALPVVGIAAPTSPAH